MRVSITLNLFWRHYNQVYRLSYPVQIHINIADELSLIEFSLLDHKKIDIAMRTHCATSRRAKQDDPIRLGNGDDTPNDLTEDL